MALTFHERAFWIQRDRWPVSTKSHLFLCEAVQAIGAAMFGDQWTGHEVLSPAPVGLPSSVDNIHEPLAVEFISPEKIAAVEQIHVNAGGEPFNRLEGLGFTRPTPDEWSAALKSVESSNTEKARAISRFAAVKKNLIGALRDGHVQSVLRPIQGGAFSLPLEPHLWNSERIDCRFAYGQMNWFDPFEGGTAGYSYQYIFIVVATLNRFLAEITRVRTGTATAAGEDRAIAELCEALKQDARLTKRGAFDLVAHHNLSENGFQWRVWPKARERAGLSTRAPAGRPRKS